MNRQTRNSTLNLFALPNQTTVLFLTIVSVILAIFIVASIGQSILPSWPLALALLVIPWRSFFAAPDKVLYSKHRLFKDEGFEHLRQEIAALSKKMDLPRAPKLVIWNSTTIQAQGSFRRWFIIIGRDEAIGLEDDLNDPQKKDNARAVLSHELYHFKTGDFWQLEYTNHFVRTTFFVMIWAFIFFTGFAVMLYLAMPEFASLDAGALLDQAQNSAPPPLQQTFYDMIETIRPQVIAFMDEFQPKLSSINWGAIFLYISGTTFFPILMAWIIWAFYLPKMYRTREFYADAGSAHTLGNATPISNALDERKAREKASTSFLKIISPSFHPPIHARQRVLALPEQFVGNLSTTIVLAASIGIILDFFMQTPATLLVYAQWPMHFISLVIIVIVSLNYVVPTIAQGKPVLNGLFKIISILFAIRLVQFVLVLSFILIAYAALGPDGFQNFLTLHVMTMAKTAILTPEAVISDTSGMLGKALFASLSQVVLAAFFWISGLTIIAQFLKKLYTWYSYSPESPKPVLKIANFIVAGTCVFFAFTIIPFFSSLVMEPDRFYNIFFWIISSVGGIVAIAGFMRFSKLHKKHSKKCPTCDIKIQGSYIMGKTCDTKCNAVLHPWLFAPVPNAHSDLNR